MFILGMSLPPETEEPMRAAAACNFTERTLPDGSD